MGENQFQHGLHENTDKPKTNMRSFLVLWLGFCAFCGCAGWILSALHQLNCQGYAFSLIVAALVAGGWWVNTRPTLARDLSKLRARFKRPFPMAFLILASLAILGGALYPPNNYDAMTYRTPRVLHWLAGGQWAWIHTPDFRMNDRSCGYEWVSAPLFALARSDRFLCFPNVISYLLFPGLTFSVLRRIGVARRVAWNWMWLLPAGYNFVLQAASATNDLFSAVFALAAMDFALRARESGKAADLWQSMISAALLTAAKASNLPLLLPIAIALLPCLGQLIARPVWSCCVLIVACLCSFLPNAILNQKNCGDWTGSILEPSAFRIHRPLIGIAGNMSALVLDGLWLPVMPLPSATGEKLARCWLPKKLLTSIDNEFASPFGFHWGSGIQTEDAAGLGLGLCALALAAVFTAWIYNRNTVRSQHGSLAHWALIISPWVSLLVYLANAGMGEEGRLLTPYYAFLLPLLLSSSGQTRVVRQPWWRWGGIIAFLMAALLLILSPARPLVPAETLLQRLHRKSGFLERAEMSYAANQQRSDGLGSVRSLIPPGATRIGFVSSGNDIEPSLWRPFGTRQVQYILPSDTAADVRRRGLEYVILGGATLQRRGDSLDNWLKQYDAEKVSEAAVRRSFPPYTLEEWYVAKLR